MYGDPTKALFTLNIFVAYKCPSHSISVLFIHKRTSVFVNAFLGESKSFTEKLSQHINSFLSSGGSHGDDLWPF